VFKEVANELKQFIDNADLSGYNSNRFDIPLLMEEFLRAGIVLDMSNRKMLDVQTIFHMMEKRTLGAAYKFYCQKDIKDAHTAEADTQATMEVLMAQIERYDGQDVTDGLGKKIGEIRNDMEVLSNITASDVVDLAGRMIRNDKGEEIFNFGKHKNKIVTEVFKAEPSYYDWMMNGDFPLDTKRRLTEIKLKGFKK